MANGAGDVPRCSLAALPTVLVVEIVKFLPAVDMARLLRVSRLFVVLGAADALREDGVAAAAAMEKVATAAQVGDYLVLPENDAKWGLWGAHPSQTGGFSLVVLTAPPEKLEKGKGVAAAEEVIGGVRVSTLLRRSVCWVYRVQVLACNGREGHSAWAWCPFPDAQFGRRWLTLNQLAMAIPSAQLCAFVKQKSRGVRVLSEAGVHFKNGNLAHKFKP